ncbi:histidine kinase [Streptomyces sp. NPDC051320]|uniref:sensor histidine kinase n=1 Tax=Streptomyces sp. NPDC051320 TaxID=3154644 RepID=UPI00343522CD
MAALTWIRGVRGRGGLAQLDLYTRGSLYFLLWLAVAVQVALSVTRPVRHSDAPVALITASCLLAVAQGVCSTALTSGALRTYLGGAAVPRRLIAAAAALMVADLAAVLALTSTVGMAEVPGASVLLCAPVVPFTLGHCLIVRRRTTVLVQLVLLVAVCGTVALLGTAGALIVACLISFTCGPAWFACASRCSAWYLRVMWKLQQAQDVQAQLAVAEERLRFGRDLHDVMGRNLAVIALKSELAVGLARRGRPEAVAQMEEVQRLAQESQREVRAVVRGYRDTDLHVELEGARGVLEAAGITCEVTGSADGLTGDVQSALGWVVREAATNVLRHGDARRCVIDVSRSASDARLTVDNNGAAGTAGAATTGSGLAGLRERLAALGGTLVAGRAGDGRFRLTAEVPLGAVRGGSDGASGAGRACGVAEAGGAGDAGRAGGTTGASGAAWGEGALA